MAMASPVLLLQPNRFDVFFSFFLLTIYESTLSFDLTSKHTVLGSILPAALTKAQARTRLDWSRSHDERTVLYITV